MDSTEFSARVERCMGGLYRTAVAILGRSADAEDAVQEALLSAWRGVGRLRQPQYFETWLTRILINECRNALNRRARAPQAGLDSIAELPAPEHEPPDPALNAALMRLPERYRIALVLHFANGFTQSETAQAMGISLPAVKWRVHQGRKLLIELYDEEARFDEE